MTRSEFTPIELKIILSDVSASDIYAIVVIISKAMLSSFTVSRVISSYIFCDWTSFEIVIAFRLWYNNL